MPIIQKTKPPAARFALIAAGAVVTLALIGLAAWAMAASLGYTVARPVRATPPPAVQAPKCDVAAQRNVWDVIGHSDSEPLSGSKGSPLVIDGRAAHLDILDAGREALWRARRCQLGNSLVVVVRHTDDYGRAKNEPGLTLTWSPQDLERIDWWGIDEYKLLNLSKLKGGAVDGPYGEDVMRRWCESLGDALTKPFCEQRPRKIVRPDEIIIDVPPESSDRPL